MHCASGQETRNCSGNLHDQLPASAGGQGGGGDVADGGGLQGRGGHARAHEEHLWFAVDLFCGPWKMITSAEYIKQSRQQVLITWYCVNILTSQNKEILTLPQKEENKRY